MGFNSGLKGLIIWIRSPRSLSLL